MKPRLTPRRIAAQGAPRRGEGSMGRFGPARGDPASLKFFFGLGHLRGFYFSMKPAVDFQVSGGYYLSFYTCV
jgi:hypothetical protein